MSRAIRIDVRTIIIRRNDADGGGSARHYYDYRRSDRSGPTRFYDRRRFGGEYRARLVRVHVSYSYTRRYDDDDHDNNNNNNNSKYYNTVLEIARLARKAFRR